MAIAVRLWGTWSWPPPGGLGYEEAQLGGTAMSLLEEAAHPPEHRLPTYAAALSFALLGPGISALRLPFILIGSLIPLLFFAVSRKLASWEVSLFATALLAVSWWSIGVTRFADEVFFVAGLQLAAIWLLLHYLETRRPWAAAMLGLAAGAFLTEYTAYHLVPLLVFGYLAARVVGRVAALDLRGGSHFPWSVLRADVARHLAGATALVLAFLPFAVSVVISEIRLGGGFFLEGFLRHARGAGAPTRLALPDHLQLVVTRLGHLLAAAWTPGRGDPTPWLSSGAQPMFDRATAVVLLLSLLVVTATFWRRRHALLLLWLVIPCAIFLAFPDNENLGRYVVVLPIAYLVITLGAEVVWRAIEPRPVRGALLALGGAVVLCSSWANLSFFFGHVVRDPAIRENFREPAAVIAGWVATTEPDSLIWLLTDVCPELPTHPDTRWLIAGRAVRLADSPDAVLPSPVPPSGPLYYLVVTRPAPPAFARLVAQEYPDAEALPPIDIPHADLRILPIRIADPRRLDSTVHPSSSGRFQLSFFAGPDGEPAAAGRPPEGSELRASRRDPMISHLAIPLPLRSPSPGEGGGAEERLWVAASGALSYPRDERLQLRLVVGSGAGWVWLGDRLLTRADPDLGGGDVTATCALPAGPESVPLRVLYRHDGAAPPRLQVSLIGADGSERIATAAGTPSAGVTIDGAATGALQGPQGGQARPDGP